MTELVATKAKESRLMIYAANGCVAKLHVSVEELKTLTKKLKQKIMHNHDSLCSERRVTTQNGKVCRWSKTTSIASGATQEAFTKQHQAFCVGYKWMQSRGVNKHKQKWSNKLLGGCRKS